MDILIFGGFLGSGKTTVVNRILRGIADKGQTAAIIENEIGDVGIDAAYLGNSGLSVTQLFGGCVCCQITGSLLDASMRIEDELHPDWLIVEMTGLALVNGIKEVFGKYGRAGVAVHTVSVLDISRWHILKQVFYPLLKNQLIGADIVLMNKSDLAPVNDEIRAEVAEISGGASTLEIAATLESFDLWNRLESLIRINC